MIKPSIATALALLLGACSESPSETSISPARSTHAEKSGHAVDEVTASAQKVQNVLQEIVVEKARAEPTPSLEPAVELPQNTFHAVFKKAVLKDNPNFGLTIDTDPNLLQIGLSCLESPDQPLAEHVLVYVQTAALSLCAQRNICNELTFQYSPYLLKADGTIENLNGRSQRRKYSVEAFAKLTHNEFGSLPMTFDENSDGNPVPKLASIEAEERIKLLTGILEASLAQPLPDRR